MIETKRIKNFRLSIAKQIPRFPNDKASLQILEAKSLGALLIDYANWAIRYVATRPRRVIIESTAINDRRWASWEADIRQLLRKVETGDDLTPHLSLKPHTRGFTPAASAQGPDVDRWADKDMLLNVMGYHHLHLDAAPTQGMRSDEMVFAQVTRDTFTVVGIFDHSVFEATTPTAVMTAERERLWEIFDERTTRGVPPGAVVMTPPIATSGHPVQLVMMASDYARTIHAIDPKLNDRSYVQGLFEEAHAPVPAKPELRWRMHFLDLCLVDKAETCAFVLRKGPN